jgi:hypothetical protein
MLVLMNVMQLQAVPLLSPRQKQTPWPLVRKRTIQTERSQRPSKLMPTFAGRGSCVVNTSDPYGRESLISRAEQLFFLSCSSSIILTKLSGPRSTTTAYQKMWNRSGDLWICSQEFWPLDYRGGHFCLHAINNTNIAVHQTAEVGSTLVVSLLLLLYLHMRFYPVTVVLKYYITK